MNDYERVLQEVNYKLTKSKIYSYFIVEDFSKELKMVEIVDSKGNTSWNYFDKQTGLQKRGV
jgi:hypothetical protein